MKTNERAERVAPMPTGSDAVRDAEADAEAFRAWFSEALLSSPPGEAHAALATEVVDVVCRWRQPVSRGGFSQSTWTRLSKHDRLLKEAQEALPALAFARRVLEEDSAQWAGGRATLVDLCSGVGYLGMLCSELLPPAALARVVLLDKAFQHKEQQAGVLKPHQINPTHLTDRPWPVPLVAQRADITKASSRGFIDRILFEHNTDGPVLLLGIHLCGNLSVQAVDLFNRQPRAAALLLKPCCLPGPGFEVQHGEAWSLGGRSFATADVVVRGKWNGAQGGWHGGPPKPHQAKKFAAWVEALHGGTVPGPGGKAETVRVRMREEEWHYQDAFVLARRPPSSSSSASSAAAACGTGGGGGGGDAAVAEASNALSYASLAATGGAGQAGDNNEPGSEGGAAESSLCQPCAVSPEL